MANTNDDDLKKENERLRQDLAKSEAEKKVLEQDREYQQKVIAKQAEIIARAKDINPVKKSSLSRTKRLCDSSGLDLEKVSGGYQLSFGFSLKRVFKKLSHIFDILVRGDWYLADIFKPDYFAPNKYGYVPPNSSFNNSAENSIDDCSSEPISQLKKNLASVGSLTTSVIHEVISSVFARTRQVGETVDKYADVVSGKLPSIPFVDSYTDETLNQAQNSYNTWHDSLDDFSPA
jgi:hypothetical protein